MIMHGRACVMIMSNVNSLPFDIYAGRPWRTWAICDRG